MKNNESNDITILPPVHTSEDTAFLIKDYPYGFTLRCMKRVYIETTKQGQRLVEQTSNPKASRIVWNKPKKSTYNEVMVLYIDNTTGYLESDSLNGYNISEFAGKFLEKYADGLTTSQKNKLTISKAMHQVYYDEKLRLTNENRAEFYSRVNEVLAEWGRNDLKFVKKLA